MRALLGIDTGTTSVSSALYDIDGHAVRAASSLPHNAYLPSSEFERVQDLDVILTCIIKNVRQTIALARDQPSAQPISIEGISVTGQMHGYTLLDETLEAVGPFTTWEDCRAVTAGPDGVSWLAAFRDHCKGIFTSDSGIAAAPGYASVNLYIARRRDEIPASARWVVSIQDWLVSQLTGEHPMTDASSAHSTGFYDPGTSSWHPGLTGRIEVTEMMPPVVPPGTKAGALNRDFAGIHKGTPVFVGMGDNQASFLAAINNPATEALVTIGTGSQVSALVNGYRLVPGLDTRPFAGDRFLLVGAPLCGGRAYAMMRDFIREIGVRVFESEIDDVSLYERMGAIAEMDSTILCRTAFAGTRRDPNATGSFSEIDSENFRIGPFVGGVMRGIAQELFGLYSGMSFEALGVVATGNAVRKNELLLRAITEEFGVQALLCPFEEEAAAGAALVAGIGLGVFKRFDDAFSGLSHSGSR